MGNPNTNPENRISYDQDMEKDEGPYKADPMNQSGKQLARDGYSVLDRKAPGEKERRGLSAPRRRNTGLISYGWDF